LTKLAVEEDVSMGSLFLSQAKKILFGIYTAFFALAATPLSAQQVDLHLLTLHLTQSTVKPGETIELDYSLKAQGSITSAFNMGIFIAKGGNGIWSNRWGLPNPLLEQLQRGQAISQKWSITIPDWGEGEYRISISADPENALLEKNRDNNTMEKMVVVGNVAPPGQLSVLKPLRVTGAKRRTIRSDGSFEIHFSDGSSKVLNRNGKITLNNANGTSMTPYSLQVPAADLPPLPDQADAWVEDVQRNLLTIIEEQLDDTEIVQYMESETGRNNYDLVLWRIKFIDFILSEK
jgi:hypothetical protein